MNVYDFDQTIYRGDSTRDFYFFCLKKYPRILLCLPSQLWHFLLYLFGIHTKTAFKERFYCFFRKIPSIDLTVRAFWDRHFVRIKPWYLQTRKEDDVIISASPAFLLSIPCEKLGLPAPIASLVDPKTGTYTGENCYGEEKVRRFSAVHPSGNIHAFFSDSLSDAPMAALAAESFIVKGNKKIPWHAYRQSFLSRTLHTFFSPAFFRYTVIGAISTLNNAVFASLYTLLFPIATLNFSLGYLSSLIVGFFLHSFFTFRCRPTVMRFWKFTLSYIPNYLIQLFLVWLFCDILFMPHIFSYFAAALIGVPVTFLLMKLFAFRK